MTGFRLAPYNSVVSNSYEVVILNQRLVLKTENDENHVRHVTEYVNRVFDDIKGQAQNVSTQNIAILGALNIAEQMLLREENNKKIVTDWKNRLQNLLQSRL